MKTYIDLDEETFDLILQGHVAFQLVNAAWNLRVFDILDEFGPMFADGLAARL